MIQPLSPAIAQQALLLNKVVPPVPADHRFECVIECDTCSGILGRLYSRPLGGGVNVNVTIPAVVPHTCALCQGQSRRNHDRT